MKSNVSRKSDGPREDFASDTCCEFYQLHIAVEDGWLKAFVAHDSLAKVIHG